jgi:phosphate transport system protein
MTDQDQMTDPKESTGPSHIDQRVEAILAQIEGDVVTPPVAAGRPTLDNEERLLSETILRMGSLVEDAIRKAAKALVDHDSAAASEIIRNDPVINELQRAITRLIAVTIATQQPVAKDLRYLLTLDHVSYELERIGDHASSLAKQVVKLAPLPPLNQYVHLPEMASRGADLLHEILRALIDGNPIEARHIAAGDDDIDRLYHATFEECVRLMQADPDNAERATRIVIASHYLERIGDRATNIAEDVVFLASGEVEDLNP